MSKLNRISLVALFLAGFGLRPLRAVDVSGISIHGSASLTESSSDLYNFYGDTAGKFDNNVRELTLNGSYRWSNGLRLSTQAYASDVDGISGLNLDFACLDYSVETWFGIRLGRNKSTVGLYGDSQDLDQVRTFANLPLGFYPRTARLLNYVDGLILYGHVSAGKAGSFDYTGALGRLEPIAGNALTARSGGGLTTTDRLDIPGAYGMTVFWNAPVDGLRFGITSLALPHIGVTGHLSTKAFATNPGLTFSSTPLLIDGAYGAGTWDHAFAGTSAPTTVSLAQQILSAEYTTGNWLFAAEWRQEPEHVLVNIPALGVKNLYQRQRTVASYAMVTYQATKQIGLGSYYGFSDSDTINSGGTPADFRDQTDAAAVIAYAPLPWWLLKVEFHEMNGLGLVNNAGDLNPTAPTAGTTWNYLVLKSTISF